MGEKNIILGDFELDSYSRDQSPFPDTKPEIAIRPRTTKEVSEIVSFCAQDKIPILPFGSGYSFSGLSNRARSRTLVMDLKRMTRILEVNRKDLYVRSECGIIVGKLADKILSSGLYLSTVSVPYYKDKLGGVISGVIGGGIPQFSSSMGFNNRHTILGLKVVLPDGIVVETSGKGANVHGFDAHMRETNAPDITGLFVSDGGSFGVKTEATLAIQPLPPEWDYSSWVFDGFDNA
ncbi:MAG: FAD-binding oxidoreductase [Nitrososphaerota archaeon]|nr:FAD-binding oxidoreductase [Nitrososphaerota archaeon]MDG6922112.1 FAD-binding oxidoreductase [Nitrososphaerota archaeon]